MSAFKELSETETEIMEVLWSKNEAVSFGWLMDYFNTQRGKQWKRQTLSTFMLRLAEKNVIVAKNQGRQMFYCPTMTKKQHESAKANGILDTLYSSSIKNFITALYDGEHLSKQQIDDLKKWLKDK